MQQQIDQLERQGYTVFPKFLDTETTARIREHMDSLLPPPEPRDEDGARRLFELRHPIPGAIMADIVNNPQLLDIARKILFADDLKLLEQVLIRTDPREATQGPTGATGWHIDMAFLPEHYNARPRQTYFHMVHILNPIEPGGGGTAVVPGSHHLTYAAAEKLGSVEELTTLKNDPIGVAGIDVSQAIEMQPQEGDLFVFNPMCLHSASVNTSSQSRYVYFASFMDSSAQYLREFLDKTGYQRAFPDSLRDNLPTALQSLIAA